MAWSDCDYCWETPCVCGRGKLVGRAEHNRLRKALEFYAKEENWEDLGSTVYDDYVSKTLDDRGEIARRALNAK